MSYQQWQNATTKISPFTQSNELKEITRIYKIFSFGPNNPTNIRNLKTAYDEWKQCDQYRVERYKTGSLAVQGLRNDAGIKTMSAYRDDLPIDDVNGAVTMLAYTGFIGGHTHLAFEYMDSTGNYRHQVFHLVALESGCDQDCKGTTAAVLKQIPLPTGKYGFAGDVGGYTKAQAKHIDQPQESFILKPFGDYERNLPNDRSWTTKSCEKQTVSVKTAIVRNGHLICRKLARGDIDEDVTRNIDATNIEHSRFHRTKSSKGTNCLKFAMAVLRKINIHANALFKLWALTSPPRALKFGVLSYVP